jgi:hypothetical protein
MALVDRRMVPLEGMENRTPVLPLCDGLPLVGCLGQPTGAHVTLLLSFEYPPSATSCLSPQMFLSWLIFRNGRLMCVIA